MSMPRTPLTRALATIIGLGLLTAACGGDDAGGSASGKTVTVEAVDYGFKGLPARVKAGTTLKLKNTSKAEAHELVAVRLDDADRRSAGELVRLSEEQLMGLFTGPPALVLLAPPGGGDQIVAEGDGKLSQPGRYLVLCTVPTGADPAVFLGSSGPGPIPGGAPHHHNGMFAELVVE